MVLVLRVSTARTTIKNKNIKILFPYINKNSLYSIRIFSIAIIGFTYSLKKMPIILCRRACCRRCIIFIISSWQFLFESFQICENAVWNHHKNYSKINSIITLKTKRYHHNHQKFKCGGLMSEIAFHVHIQLMDYPLSKSTKHIHDSA